MKKMNQKGFSLIELIIVLAIMAVLVVILAPQFISYIEKSRQEKDEFALGEVMNAAKVSLSEEFVYSDPQTDGAKVIIVNGDKVTSTSPPLQEALQRAMPDEVELCSRYYKERGGESITIEYVIPFETYVMHASWE